VREATAVLVFARAPEAGRTKRRLIPALGAGGAADLHRRMILYTVRVALAADVGPVVLCCTSDVEHPLFERLAAHYGLERRAQARGDLGARLAVALGAALAEHRAALAIGTDCPALEPQDLREAAARLAAGCDAAIGPAEDGGYYLIGLSRPPAPALFEDVPWGGEGVLAHTRRALGRLGWRSAELAPRSDIDRPEDLGAANLSRLPALDDPLLGALRSEGDVSAVSPRGSA